MSSVPINIQATAGSPGYQVNNKPAENLLENLKYTKINNQIFIIDKYNTYSEGKITPTFDYYTTAVACIFIGTDDNGTSTVFLLPNLDLSRSFISISV